MIEIEEGECPVCGSFPTDQQRANETLDKVVLSRNSKAIIHRLLTRECGVLYNLSEFVGISSESDGFKVVWFKDHADADGVFIHVLNWRDGGQATAWCSSEM